MTTAFDDDPDVGPATKVRRSAEETRELVAEMRAANPSISRTELADALGITTRRLYDVLKDSDEPPPPRTKSANTEPKKSKQEKLAEKLCDPIAKLAIPLSFTLPTVAAVLVQRGEATANALVAIAADHPRMLAALEKVSKVGPATDLAETGILIVLAASLDTGKLPPEHPLAMITGLSQTYMQTHPEYAAEKNGQVTQPFPPFPFPAPGMPVP